MMDCAHYRRSMLADPRDPDPLLREHRESCHDCTLYSERLLRFESRLERALSVTVPSGAAPASGAATPSDAMRASDAVPPSDPSAADDKVVPLRAESSRPVLRSPAYRKGWLAMAASVLMAFVVAGGLWVSAPGPSLAADVVTHMREEPQAWRRTDVPVPSPKLEDVLRDSHLRLATGPGTGIVSYANSCEFRGHQVPHLVIQTEAGPVTVMVLVHESSPKTVQFDEQGYRGVIVPVAGHGSLAVLTRGPATDMKTIEAIAHRVLDSIVWTG
jgi:Protein of unknown function (DUF3379)